MRHAESALLSWTTCNQAGRWSCAAEALAVQSMLRSIPPQVKISNYTFRFKNVLSIGWIGSAVFIWA